MSRILCVDAGLAHIGAAVIETNTHLLLPTFPPKPKPEEIVQLYYFGTEKCDQRIKLRMSDDKHRRVQECARFYAEVVRRHDIKRAACELPQWGAPNSQSSVDLCFISIPLVASLEVLGVAVEWYSPQEAKRAATGRSHATKGQVMAAMEARFPRVLVDFPTAGKREHVCDALSVWMAAKDGALARL